jgi:hypothetical protein
MTSAEGTCQVCARRIKAPGGLIAHHGYQRPGRGWQTESCEGARYEPFERSSARLCWWITKLGEWISNKEAIRANIVAEYHDLILTHEKRIISVNRLTYAHALVTLPPYVGRRAPTWEEFKAKAIQEIDSQINDLRLELKTQNARLRAWRKPPELTLEELDL